MVLALFPTGAGRLRMTIGELYVLNQSYHDWMDQSDVFLLLSVEMLPNAVRKDLPPYYRYTFLNLNTNQQTVFNHAESVFDPLGPTKEEL
jgi:hypothetical protein